MTIPMASQTSKRTQVFAGRLSALRPDILMVHSQVLLDTLRRIDKTFKSFFRRVKEGKRGKKVGYPRFRSKARYDSFTYPQAGFELSERVLQLSKIGSVKIKQHRPIRGTIKTLTIKRENDGSPSYLRDEAERFDRFCLAKGSDDCPPL